MRLLGENCNPDNFSPLTLAFVGDGVYELFVREHLACLANRPAGELNSRKVQLVKASAQAEAFKKISNLLSERSLQFLNAAEMPTLPIRPKMPLRPIITRQRDLRLFSAGCTCRSNSSGQRNFLK